MDGVALVREYYRLIDAAAYDSFDDVLSETVVHHRPDMTLEGIESFVSFMRGGRPARETEHVIESVYTDTDGTKVAAEGGLYHDDGELWFRFVDTFEVGPDGIERIRTHTDIDPGHTD
jgi:ketosteroid isomerase-like protein